MAKKTYNTDNVSSTEQLAARLAPELSKVSVIALSGDLGAGKTAFVRGLAAAMGALDRVSSPTYALVNEYRGARKICHFDLYRLSSGEELWDIGFEDYLKSGALCVIEWAEIASDLLPPDTIYINIEKISENDRRICIHDNTCH